MSFFTSFMFLFSVGAPAERREATLSLPIERLSSARAFGVLAGVLFVRFLAILVSSPWLRSRPSVLLQFGSRFANFFLALAYAFVAGGLCSHRPSSGTQLLERFLPRLQIRQSEQRRRHRRPARSWQHRRCHALASRR